MKLIPDMHRITNQQADWDRIPQEQWTDIQRRAAETHGIDTPGNRETVKGLLGGLASIACVAKGNYLLGTILMGYSRYKDLKDGKVADETGTKSHLGETLDVLVDNTLVAIGTPIFMKKEVIATTEGLAMGGIVAAKFIGSGTAKMRKREMHASRTAKIGQLFQGIGVGGRLAWKALDSYGMKANRLKKTSDIALWTGIGLSAASSIGYIATALKRTEQSPLENKV